MDNHKHMAYALLRIAFGINFLGHGVSRILSGTGVFAHGMAEHMTKSPLPITLVVGFGYCIPFVELMLGLALILGVFTRYALALGAVFLMVLTIGVTANQQWDIAGQQLLYSLVFFVLLFFAEYNCFAFDKRMRGTPIQSS